jgi:hypothetical protein
MVQRIKDWLAAGDEVKIFTARVTPSNPNAGRERMAIKKFCKETFGQDLEITAIKEPEFTDMWDDKAVSVEPNTGRVLTIGAEGVSDKTEQSSGKVEQTESTDNLPKNDLKLPIKHIGGVTAMVVDMGYFVDTAVRLARDYKKVYYCCPNVSPCPKMAKSYIGFGMENIELCESIFGPHFDDVDLFVFPMAGFGHEQAYLESIGKAVWGSRMGEELETERIDMKKAMAKLGLPVGKYSVVRGISALREYLKAHENVFVKIGKWRGEFESFKSTSYKIIEPRIDQIEHAMGAMKTLVEFVIEDELPDKVEIGCDAYTVDGKFPSQMLAGIEIKDKAYAGAIRPYKDFPKPILQVNDALAPLMKQYGYRGNFSTEMRVGKDKKPYLIDITARQPMPPSELYLELYTNFAEIILNGAYGKCIDPVPASKFGVQANLCSSWAEKNTQPIYFDQKYRNQIKLHNACKIDGTYYIVPQEYEMDLIGAVVGWGDTMEAAIAHCKKAADTIEGYQIDVFVDALKEAEAELEKSAKMGMEMV